MAKKEETTAVAQENALSRYFRETRGELRKVTWPTLQETRKATLAVLGFVAVMAVILGLVDFGLSSLIKTLLS